MATKKKVNVSSRRRDTGKPAARYWIVSIRSKSTDGSPDVDRYPEPYDSAASAFSHENRLDRDFWRDKFSRDGRASGLELMRKAHGSSLFIVRGQQTMAAIITTGFVNDRLVKSLCTPDGEVLARREIRIPA